MSAAYEVLKKEAPKYYLSLDTLEGFEIPSTFVQPDKKLQTSMTKDSALVKLNYLLQQGYFIPENWYYGEGEGLSVSDDYIALVNTLYSLISEAETLNAILNDNDSGDLSNKDAETVLESTNLWLDGRVLKDQVWRNKITFTGRICTVEGYKRRRGRVVNIDSKVSEEELIDIVYIFKNHFIPKK